MRLRGGAGDVYDKAQREMYRSAARTYHVADPSLTSAEVAEKMFEQFGVAIFLILGENT